MNDVLFSSKPSIGSFLAIIPLDKVCLILSLAGGSELLTKVQLLAFATDDLSLRLGQTMTGLLNVTLVRLTVPLNADTCLLMKQHLG
jgi:hypothetical protein